jgi:hypothetical protein
MHQRPTTELRISNGGDPTIPEGARLQTAWRPEYGDTVRIVAWKLPGKQLYTDLKAVRFISRSDTCTVDCGHIVPGNPLECT